MNKIFFRFSTCRLPRTVTPLDRRSILLDAKTPPLNCRRPCRSTALEPRVGRAPDLADGTRRSSLQHHPDESVAFFSQQPPGSFPPRACGLFQSMPAAYFKFLSQVTGQLHFLSVTVDCNTIFR
ncbi:hypothetical protein KSP40_PGU005905 [Platanthera guangdongensis]|uniref:Uncharacterized protein n=1 Tax=Platanthera guangdongensis TaxID=2320717 RepID=A0ABR2MXG3_9ASPA